MTQAGTSEFGEAVSALERDHADTYVRVGFGDADDPTPWMVFTDEPAAEVLDAVANLPMDVDVFYGAPASGVEPQGLAAPVVSVLNDQPGVVSAEAGVYGKGEVIRGTYFVDGSLTGSEQRRLEQAVLEKIAAGQAEGRLPVPITVALGEGVPPAIAEPAGDLP
ncbi:MAG: hypothetical protein ACK5LN_06240 [Propioniciclava sp.]